ncbi:MAG: hypothetical protein ABW127_15930 [Candidatus Thiodiazotropha endolucinida]
MAHVCDKLRFSLIGGLRLLFRDQEISQEIGNEYGNNDIGCQQAVTEELQIQPKFGGSNGYEKADIRECCSCIQVGQPKPDTVAYSDKQHDGEQWRTVFTHGVETIKDDGIVTEQG